MSDRIQMTAAAGPRSPAAPIPAASSRRRVLRFLAAGLWLMVGATAFAQSLEDVFINRRVFTTPSGAVSADNSTATVEPNEPQTGGKPGGHSVWLSWVAPADGIVTFSTDGSGFDTLLSAYVFNNPTDTTLDRLHEAARNDDFLGIAPSSLIEFGVQAGGRYEIAVDGFAGATGSIRLKWSFVNAASPPPIVVSVPPDRAARRGETVTLSVNIQPAPGVQLQWRFNETEIDQQGPTLVIPSLQAAQVGTYRLRVTVGKVRFFTTPVEIQINSDGLTNALARDKIPDAVGSPLVGDDGLRRINRRLSAFTPAPIGGHRVRPSGFGVVRGYNGSQIFNTFYATSDPTEPKHCGVTGGRSYWLAYDPPSDGTLSLDTVGSDYDTVLEAYTYNGLLTGYSDLVSLACANDSFGTNGPSKVRFQVSKGHSYLIAVDGVGGASGIASLNYALETNAPGGPPVLLQAPASQLVSIGSNLTLTAPVSGAGTLVYSWEKDGLLLPGSTDPSLVLPAVKLSDSGQYRFAVTNAFGGISGVFIVKVVVPPLAVLGMTADGPQLSFQTFPGQIYSIEEALVPPGPWTPRGGAFPGDGGIQNILLTNVVSRYFRVLTE